MLGNPIPYKNTPRIRPDFQGPAGKAWHLTIPSAGPEDPRRQVTLDGFLIHAPGSHPFWSWYTLTGCALRATEGLPPANLHFAAATHEIIVAALDPREPLPDVTNGKDLAWMIPLDQVVQVCLGDDNQARELQRQVVRAVVKGMLVPDQDHRATWKKVLAKTSEHLREGGHDGDR